MEHCHICDKQFDSLLQKNKHVCIWYCIECCKVFHYKHVYKRHIDIIHGEHKKQTVIKNNSNECEYCKKVFSTVSNKNKHTKKCKQNQKASKDVSKDDIIQQQNKKIKQLEDVINQQQSSNTSTQKYKKKNIPKALRECIIQKHFGNTYISNCFVCSAFSLS